MKIYSSLNGGIWNIFGKGGVKMMEDLIKNWQGEIVIICYDCLFGVWILIVIYLIYFGLVVGGICMKIYFDVIFVLQDV